MNGHGETGSRRRGAFERRAALPFGVLCLLTLASAAYPQQPATAPADVRARINAVIVSPEYRAARIGVHAVALDTGETVYTFDADKLFVPASNMKLLSTALALMQLGPDYRWRTSVYAAGRPDATGRVAGDLVLYGRGDPSISSRFSKHDPFARVEELASRVAASGVRRVAGRLVADESYFRGERFGEGWEWDDLQWRSGAEVSALSINDNVVGLRVAPGRRPGDPCGISVSPPTGHVRVLNRTKTVGRGGIRFIGVYRAQASNVVEVWGTLPVDEEVFEVPVAVHDPAALFGEVFRAALARHAVEVEGPVVTVDWREREQRPFDPATAVELAWVEGEPLSAVVRATNKDSQNLYAELLLRTVGRVKGDPAAQSDHAGSALLLELLRAAGADPFPIVAVDGSGLSKNDLVTPSALVRLVTYMRLQRVWGVYADSLPVAAVDGTLRGRFKDSPAVARVRAKTGTLANAAALTGFLTTKSGRELAFAVLVNNQPRSGPPAARAVDQIVLALADL